MPDNEALRTRLDADLKYKFNRCDPEVVNDAVSEAITIVIAECPPEEVMQNEHKLYAWHFRIAFRYVVDSLEKRKRESPIGDYDTFSLEADFADRLADRLATIECLRCLSVAEREAVVLHKMLGYSVDEVSSICHISRNSVKDRLKRGMNHLRDFFSPPPPYNVDNL